MKKPISNIPLCCLMACCLFWLCPTYTPAVADSSKIKSVSSKADAQELAAKILAAYGGEKKFRQVYEQGWHGFGKYTQISLLSGAANNFDVEIFNKGNKVRQEMSVLGDQMVGGFDGNHSWLKQAGEVIEDNPSKADLTREEIEHGLQIVLKLPDKNTFLEIKNLPDKSVDALVVKTADGSTTLICADKNSHLIASTEFIGTDEEQGLSVTKSFHYDDYRPCLGTMLPYGFSEYSDSKKVLQVVLSSIKPETLSDAIFQTPKKRQCLLGKEKSVTIPFQYAAGEIIINVGINGKSNFAFVVDTGATQSLVDSSQAPQLGKIETSDLSITTGSGSVPMGYMKIDSLTLGTLDFKAIPVAVADLSALRFIPGKKITGLLGANILRQFVITFDFPKQTLTLSNPDNRMDNENATILSAKPSLGGSALMIEGELDGKKLDCLIDTGAAYSLIPHELAGQIPGKSVPGRSSVRGLDGKAVRVATGRFETLKLGDINIKQPEFYIAGPNAKLGGMIANGSVAILGNPIWRNYALTLDYRRQRVILRGPLPPEFNTAAIKNIN